SARVAPGQFRDDGGYIEVAVEPGNGAGPEPPPAGDGPEAPAARIAAPEPEADAAALEHRLQALVEQAQSARVELQEEARRRVVEARAAIEEANAETERERQRVD